MSCQQKVENPNKNLSLDDYSVLADDAYKLSAKRIRRDISRMVVADSDSMLADYYARSYYVKRRPFVWIDRKGLDSRADTLYARLQEVKEMGFDVEKFRLPEIEADLMAVRNLNFSGKDKDVNRVAARLEYNLTKALFRFASGQQFGFANPNTLLNKLDARDSVKGIYYTLYDLGSPTPNRRFYRRLITKVGNDSLTEMLDSLETDNPYYRRLLRVLNSDSARMFDRKLLMVNMERCRWHLKDYPWLHEKYVLVNIPSLHLRAVNGSEVLGMRIGCGSLKTKTPLLSSNIVRMDINPQWIIPRSIVKKSIIPRLGNAGYFKSRHYFIRDRATGKEIEPWQASPEALLNGSQLAIQEGGEGNALGRIIFRFDNNFSIYLHDTSSREVFERADRDVSHGCIRVEKPFELASFLVGSQEKRTIERIRYSMNADVSPLGKKRSELTDEQKEVADTLQRKLLIGRVEVKPSVPVFIWYFTLYPNADGKLVTYSDIYGYDDVIYGALRNYL